jgi:hypothetical protein
MNNKSRDILTRLQDVNVYMANGYFNFTYNNYSGFIDQMRDINYGHAGINMIEIYHNDNKYHH